MMLGIYPGLYTHPKQKAVAAKLIYSHVMAFSCAQQQHVLCWECDFPSSLNSRHQDRCDGTLLCQAFSCQCNEDLLPLALGVGFP